MARSEKDLDHDSDALNDRVHKITSSLIYVYDNIPIRESKFQKVRIFFSGEDHFSPESAASTMALTSSTAASRMSPIDLLLMAIPPFT